MLLLLGEKKSEQLAGEEVDERTDGFALVVMIVEAALTGSRPFSRRTHPELLHSILNKPYHLPGGGEVSRFDALLQRCIAKDRQERYSSIADLQREVVPAIRACSTFASSPS
jgi:serine/threonine protein kinase